MNRVPEAPVEQVVISSEDTQRLEEWVSFFRQLSRRVMLLRRTDVRFNDLLIQTERAFREERKVEDEDEILDWPTMETTAFVLQIDSSLPASSQPHVELRSTYFFCFGDCAFGAWYFQWDGDESGDGKTWSLSGSSDHALSWNYVRSRIQERLMELESRVPKLSQ